MPASAIFVVTTTGAYTAKFNLGVIGSEDDGTVTITASASDGITIVDSDGLIGAGFKDDEERDLEGSLTIKATDTGSRAFEIEGDCEQDWRLGRHRGTEDKDLDDVAGREPFSVKEDREPDPPGSKMAITEAECYSVTGYMRRQRRLKPRTSCVVDIEPHNRPAHPTAILRWVAGHD